MVLIKGVPIILGGIIYENWLWSIGSLLFTIPFWLLLFFKSDYLFTPTKKWFKLITIIYAIIQLLIMIFLSMMYDFTPNENFFSESLLIGEGMGLFFIIIFFGNQFLTGFNSYMNLNMMIILTTINCLDFYNVFFSKKHIIQEKIVKKEITVSHSHGNETNHYKIYFDSLNLYSELRIKKNEYQKIVIGDTVNFQLAKGSLGYDIYFKYKIKD